MQLILNLQLKQDATFDTFFVGDQKYLLESLKALCHEKEGAQKYVYGVPGVGLSHLLQATCHYAERQGLQSVYLPLKELQSHGVEILENLEQLHVICIDDLDAIAGNPAWEEGLFHLYNRARERGCHLLFAAHQALVDLPIQLPDLRSRLAWGGVYEVHEASAEEKPKLLTFLARMQGLTLGGDVINYINHHLPRDIASLKSILKQLDEASLEQQHKITIPFLKRVLKYSYVVS